MSCGAIYPSISGTKKCPELKFLKIRMIGLMLPTAQNPFRDPLDDTSTLVEWTTNIDTEATFTTARNAVSPDTMFLSDRVYTTTIEGGEQNVVEFDSLDVLKTNGTDTIITATFVINKLDVDNPAARSTLSTQSKNNFSVFSDNQDLNFILFMDKDTSTGNYPVAFDYDEANDYAGFFSAKMVRIVNEISLADGLAQVTAEIRMPYGWTKNMDIYQIATFNPFTVS